MRKNYFRGILFLSTCSVSAPPGHDDDGVEVGQVGGRVDLWRKTHRNAAGLKIVRVGFRQT